MVHSHPLPPRGVGGAPVIMSEEDRIEYMRLVRLAVDRVTRVRLEGRREGTSLKFCKECGGQLPCKTLGCITCRDRNVPPKRKNA